MKAYPVSKIRDVVLLGHGRAGKTTLAEAMLFSAGAADRLGKTMDGNTVSDFDPEEIKRQCSINTSVLPLEWNGCKLNVLDTPGYFDFVGEQLEAVAAADGALMVISGKSGVSGGALKAWKLCNEKRLPVMIFVNKLDSDKANYHKILEQLKESFGKCIAPFQVPIQEGEHIVGFVNVVDMKARRFDGEKVVDIPVPDGMEDEIDPVRDMINEAVAETDEALMEKYFADEPFTPEEIHHALRKGVENREIVPVLCGTAQLNQGVRLLLDALVEYMPSPDERETVVAEDAGGEPVELAADDKAPLVAQCFKTIADPFIGKLSLVRVFSGTLTKEGTLYNANADADEKAGHIYILSGKKQTEADKLVAGDIGAIPKLTVTNTGDTLCTRANPVRLPAIDFPKPVMQMAILPKAKGDEEKISQGLHRLMEEDKTLAMENNAETHQQLIAGVGDQHLEVVLAKLKSKYSVNAELEAPKIPYRETITKKVKAEGKHKKQSGGHGQYGHVWIEFEPSDGEGLEFCEKVFGGAVPKNFFPAVEKGLHESMEHGVLEGYPVTGLKATLLDGSYHPVDSSEMAFKTAASLAYKAGLPQAGPVMLEPVGTLTVNVPGSYMGDLMGDINKRRGRILGSDQNDDGTVTITAEVPAAEMQSFAPDLRSLTQGMGVFSFEFTRYEQVPDYVEIKK